MRALSREVQNPSSMSQFIYVRFLGEAFILQVLDLFCTLSTGLALKPL